MEEKTTMMIQKKYYMIALLSMGSVCYGMKFNSLELFADLVARDPLALYADRKAAEIRKTTQQVNREARAAAKIASGSSGHYELVECRGPIKIVRPSEKQNISSMRKLKL